MRPNESHEAVYDLGLAQGVRTPSESAQPPASEHTGPSSGAFNRLGAFAAAACAVHCMVTPLILVLAPALGGAWMSPAVHWTLAAVSLPLAAWLLFRDMRGHRRHWISVVAIVGMISIVTGLAYPELTPLWAGPSNEVPTVVPATTCAKDCCPSVSVGPDGRVSANVPLTSAATMLGGLCLCVAHVGNLHRRRNNKCEEPCCSDHNSNR